MSKPQYIELENMGLCGVAGISGSGKSSTIRLLAAQLALMGAGLIIVDGHGTFSDQTLAVSCMPLEKSFIRPPAIHDADIISAFDFIAQIAQNRIEGKDTSKNPYVLIADEIISIISRIDQDSAKRIIAILIKFATDYRKTNVKVIIAAQNWTKDFIGSAAIRRSMNIVLLHRMAPDVIGLFSNHPIVKKQAPNLQIGQLFILAQTTDPIKVRVPNVFQDDLIAVSQHIETVVKPIETFTTVSPEVSAYETEISQFQGTSNRDKLIEKWTSEIVKLHNQGLSKTQIIKSIWSVSPGASSKYKIASKLYDATIKGYYETKIAQENW